MAFFEGFAVGLSMIIFIGPVLFTLLQSTFEFGKSSGFMVALGIIVSDILCASIYFFGLNELVIPNSSNFWFAALGSLILIGLGAKYLFQKPKITKNEFPTRMSLLFSFGKGFAVNFINPFVFVVWAGVYLYAKETFDNSNVIALYLSGVLVGIFTTDVLKVLFAKQLKPFLKPRKIQILSKIIGLILIGFAGRIILYLVTL